MGVSVKQRFVELVEDMLDSLTLEDHPEMEELVKPLRLYIYDIERFSTSKIINSKFRAFVRTRDEWLIGDSGQAMTSYQAEDIAQTQRSINQLLDQVLVLLERGLHASDDLNLDLRGVMEKVYQAKTVNNVRALSQGILAVGEKMIDRGEAFQKNLGDLSVELSFCKNQIEDLEVQLEASRKEVERDTLTGIRNRRAFEQDLSKAVERSQRFRTQLCLLLIDIDRFKDINERYGRTVGDEVLVDFGKLLAQSLREFDLIYRLGEDEFAVLFSGFDPSQAESVTERVRAFISGHLYTSNGVEFRLSISCGLVSLRAEETLEGLLGRAENLLQQAKHEGGDRVIWAQEE